MDRTPDSLTTEEIRALRAEAWEARDYDLASWCGIALTNSVTPAMRSEARCKVADAINAALAADTDASRGAAEISAMTPAECWEVYVGSQTPAEFMSQETTGSVPGAVLSYTRGSQLCDDLGGEARHVLAYKLAAYIVSQD